MTEKLMKKKTQEPTSKIVSYKLRRVISTQDSTLGLLTKGNTRLIWTTLEDSVRKGAKIAGRTAIDSGTYPLEITWSPRFKVMMPILIGVPNFSGVRVHTGNSHLDTEGCILVGLAHNLTYSAMSPGFRALISSSKEAYASLISQLSADLKSGAKIELTIVDEMTDLSTL